MDFGACRDLNGRRLRHVNDEIKLARWKRDKEKKERGEKVDEVEAARTKSGIAAWHLDVPNWNEGLSNKQMRKNEHKLENEVKRRETAEETNKRKR